MAGQVTLAIELLDKTRVGFMRVTLGLSALDELVVQEGSLIEVGGAMYEYTADEVISGYAGLATSNQAYIYVTASGSAIATSFSATAPAWDETKHGWYDGLKRCIGGLYKDAADLMDDVWVYGEWYKTAPVAAQPLDIEVGAGGLTRKTVYARDLHITASCTLTCENILVEGDLTIDAGLTLVFANTEQNPAGIPAIVRSNPFIRQGLGGHTDSGESGAGAWGGGRGAGKHSIANQYVGSGGSSYAKAGGIGYVIGAAGSSAPFLVIATDTVFPNIGGAGGNGEDGGGAYESGGGGGAGPGGGGGSSYTNHGGDGGATCLIIVRGNASIGNGVVLSLPGQASTGAASSNGAGGGGGGCLCMVVLGTYTLGGTLTVNCNGGAGSGNGVGGQGNGGGGGGGHAEIMGRAATLATTVNVAGGVGPGAAVDGGAGTQRMIDITDADDEFPLVAKAGEGLIGSVLEMLVEDLALTWRHWKVKGLTL